MNRSGKVRDRSDIDQVERTRSAFCQDSGLCCTVSACDNDRIGLERRRRPQDGAHIVGIGNPVEAQEKTRRGKIVNGSRQQRVHGDRNALMNGIAQKAIDHPHIHELGARGAVRQGLDAPRRIGRRDEAMEASSRIGDRGANCVHAIEPVGLVIPVAALHGAR